MSAAKPLSDSERDFSREAPTLPPPAPAERVSVTRYKSDAPVDEFLYRLSMGDAAGLVDAVQELFDRGCIPVLLLPRQTVAPSIGFRAELVLSFVDGETSLEKIVHASGLDLFEAMRAVAELVAEGAISLC
jgi:hypothetical protein